VESTIALIGDEVIISVDQEGFYDIMLKAITDRVFQLLGPSFDKQAYLEEVEKGRVAPEIGQGWAVPVAMLLALELGYCLGQLRKLDQHVDCDKALKDLYRIWKDRLKTLLEKEKTPGRTVH
jgi:hypothetical protein